MVQKWAVSGNTFGGSTGRQLRLILFVGLALRRGHECYPGSRVLPCLEPCPNWAWFKKGCVRVTLVAGPGAANSDRSPLFPIASGDERRGRGCYPGLNHAWSCYPGGAQPRREKGVAPRSLSATRPAVGRE